MYPEEKQGPGYPQPSYAYQALPEASQTGSAPYAAVAPGFQQQPTYGTGYAPEYQPPATAYGTDTGVSDLTGTGALLQPATQPLGANSGYDPKQWMTRAPSQLEVSESEFAEAPTVGPSTGDGMCAGLSRDSHLGSLILTLLFALPVVLFLVVDPIAGIVSFVVIYLLYILEAMCSSTSKYLRNDRDIQQVHEDFDTLRTKAPVFWWTIQNYHYERRVTTDKDGRRKTSRHRRNTHFARGQFVFNSWRDCSPLYPEFTRYALTKAKVGVDGQFGDQFTAAEYRRQKNWFYTTNIRDQMQDRAEGVDVEGIMRKVLVESDPSKTPACLSLPCFGISTVLGFSCCFRVWMESRTGAVDYKFQKQAFAVAGVSPNGMPLAPVIIQPVAYIVQPYAAGCQHVSGGGGVLL